MNKIIKGIGLGIVFLLLFLVSIFHKEKKGDELEGICDQPPKECLPI